ncbi:somatostatin receptor type 4-like [Mytilus californianus]|uniref:somatostatin receptor type 4-like n=1 Tax=Mytilus californianus TaxID=6549 RepID=UPI0022452553|nr:somatostatin receptor type 4-like [Mytilus californianus]
MMNTTYEPEEPYIPAVLFSFAQWLTTYLQPILCIFGLIGNFLSLIVFCSKKMRRVSSNIYLAALSFSSCLFLIALLLVWMEIFHVRIVHENVWCHGIIYTTYVCSFLNGWFVVCITFENYIVTFHLKRATAICSVQKARLVVLLLVLFALAFFDFSIWTTTVTEYAGRPLCTQAEKYYEVINIYTYLDAVITLILPTTVLAVLIGAIILKYIRQSALHRYGQAEPLRHKDRSLMHITRVLLAVGLSYMVLFMPSYINKIRFIIMSNVMGESYVTLKDHIINQIVLIVSYMSFCSNFIFYVKWSKNFRKGLKKLFCCAIPRQRYNVKKTEYRHILLSSKRNMTVSNV